MIQYYGSPLLKTGRTKWMLEECGLPYQEHIVDLDAGATRKPPYLDLNPCAKIPFIVDGDVKLGESMGINFYLAERYAPALWTADPLGRAQIYHWSFWAISNLQPEVLKYAAHTKGLPPERRSAADAAAAKDEGRWTLDTLERQMERTYLIEERFTVADVNCGSTVRLARRCGFELGPRTAAWMERLAARPGYQRAYAELGG